MVQRDARRPGGTIQRRRLERRLEEVLKRRLAVIVAGAGFGKSTLVRHWTARRRTVWIDGSAIAGSASALAAAIIDGLVAIGIDLTATIPGDIYRASATEAFGEDRQRAEVLAGTIARALAEHDAGEVVLVIDDVHELDPAGPAIALVASLVRQAPSELHVVALSRTELPFPIQRLRGRSEVVELAARDLAMTTDEVGTVVRATLGTDPASASLAGDIERISGGWPALVRLAVEFLRGLPPEDRPTAVADLRTRRGPLLPFLAEEVLGTGRDDLGGLIATVARLDRFDAGLCRELGVGTRDGLGTLADRGLLILAGDPPSLALHDLLRDYAREHLPLPPERLEAIATAAAHWHERRGETERAIQVAADAGRPGLVAELIARHGSDLVTRGRIETILTAGGLLPAEHRDASVEVVLGDAHAHRSAWSEAAAAYSRAEALADPAPRSSALAWRLGRLDYERGDRLAALELLDTHVPTGPTGDDARCLAVRAMAAWRLERPDAPDLARAAVELAARDGDPGARTLAHVAAFMALAGPDPTASREQLASAIREAERAGDVLQLIRLWSAADDAVPIHEQLVPVTAALQLAETAGSPTWVVRALTSRAFVATDLGRLDEALADVERAGRVAARLDTLAQMTPMLLVAEIARQRGDIAQATAGFRRLAAMATTDPDYRAYAKAGLARVIARTEPDLAARLADEAIAEGLEVHRADYRLAAGWVAILQGRPSDAAELAELALDETLGAGREATRASAIELLAMATAEPGRRRARLAEAAAIWEWIGNQPARAVNGLAQASAAVEAEPAAMAAAWTAVREAGIRASAAETAGLLALVRPVDSVTLAIRTLGGFAVLRDGAPVALSEWKSRKARDLLKILIARREAVTRDELAEILWPDDPAEALANRLAVALSLLRRVLDPDRDQPANAYIAADRDIVRLRRDRLGIDLDVFLRTARAALASDDEAGLAAAESLFAGDLFEEDAYADWAVLPREEARALYVRVARALAERAATRGDPEAASSFLRRAIARDPYDERARLALVDVLQRAGQAADARRAYQAYVDRMTELEVEPSPFPGAAGRSS